MSIFVKQWLRGVLDALGTPACRPRLLETTWELVRLVDEIIAGMDEEDAENRKEEIRRTRILLERLEDELVALLGEIETVAKA